MIASIQTTNTEIFAYSPKCQIQKCIQNSAQTSKIGHIVKIGISLINSILDV